MNSNFFVQKQYELLNHMMKGNVDSDIINDYEDQIVDRVNDCNVLLKTNGVVKFRSHTPSKTTLLSPVFFSGMTKGNKIDIAFMGLNPLYNKEMNTIEKQGKSTWSDYFDYYTSNRVFEDVVNDSAYYLRLTKIFHYMLSDKYIYGSKKNSKQNSKERMLDELDVKTTKEGFLKIFQDKSIVFPELIPFHSAKTSIPNISDLIDGEDWYKAYLDSLFNMIFNNLKDTGIVIGNGQQTSVAMKEYMRKLDNEKKGEFKCISENSIMELVSYNSKYVILLKKQWSYNDDIGGDENRELVMNYIKNIVNNIDVESNIGDLEKFTKDRFILKDAKNQEGSKANKTGNTKKESAKKSESVKKRRPNTEELQNEFWDKYIEFLNSSNNKMDINRVRDSHCIELKNKYKGALIALNIAKRSISCEFIVKNESQRKKVGKNKDNIISDLDKKVQWSEKKTQTKITIEFDGDFADKSMNTEHFIWLYNMTLLFDETFKKYVDKK